MNKEHAKAIRSLKISDLEKHPVWQYTLEAKGDDTTVRAIKGLPVSNLTGKVVGTLVRLANGNRVWGLVGNLDAKNPRMNEHFVTLSIERNGHWFDLARYHDIDYLGHGPDALARFLELPLDEVFPITFDVRKYVKGEPPTLLGTLPKEPRVRLSRAEIIAMAVP